MTEYTNYLIHFFNAHFLFGNKNIVNLTVHFDLINCDVM